MLLFDSQIYCDMELFSDQTINFQLMSWIHEGMHYNIEVGVVVDFCDPIGPETLCVKLQTRP